MKLRNIFLIFILLANVFLVIENVYAQESNEGRIVGEGYLLSRDRILRKVSVDNVMDDSILIQNSRELSITVSVSVSSELSNLILLKTETLTIVENSTGELIFSIIGKEAGDYTGSITLSGDINQVIPVTISVVESQDIVKPLVRLTVIDETITKGNNLQLRIDVFRLNPGDLNWVNLDYLVKSFVNNQSYQLGKDNITITASSDSIVKTFNLSNDLPLGNYQAIVNLNYRNDTSTSVTTFALKQSLLKNKLLGVLPVWAILVALGVVMLVISAFYFVKKQIAKRRKYQMDVDFKALPKKNEKSLFLGKIAERNTIAYLDSNQLAVHSIVAGATGGGKSIAAQVIVEEALNRGIAVIVFDPTAQWSGMLRKCVDKRMLSYYPKFGMKPSEARGYNGNVKWVLNAREEIDIKRYIKPGEIQIFALNKLDPNDIDTFVASTIVSVFHSNPTESPDLKLLLVYDEVHRLLAKFGGSGEGFIQIERACREFRKWGIGVMLISQVLSDFVGAIKANINSEFQMRTRDEEDLKRIRDKYGESMLQALVKASVGVGMFANAAYNRGRPYFVNFRPILHDTRRLSDLELENYNKYNQVIDDLESQIVQLEEYKVDIFDLKLELKLALDKLKSGNFNMVDIYLEGLKPRIEQQWKKIGKQPKKKEVKLVEAGLLKASLKKAKEERDKIAIEEKKAGKIENKKE